MIAYIIPSYCLLIITIVLILLLHYFRQPGKGGIIGHKIRCSDYHAWDDAVAYRKRELQELLNAKPNTRGIKFQEWLHNYNTLKRELVEIIALEPKI
jgi:hypothetical protein